MDAIMRHVMFCPHGCYWVHDTIVVAPECQAVVHDFDLAVLLAVWPPSTPSTPMMFTADVLIGTSWVVT